MERKESQSVGDILRLAFQENCMQDHLDEWKAIELWESVVGRNLAAMCRRPKVEAGVMTVGVPNASLRHEFTMSRSSLRNAINHAIGKETISEIRFIA